MSVPDSSGRTRPTDFEKIRNFKKICEILEILKKPIRKISVMWDDEALYESSVQKLG